MRETVGALNIDDNQLLELNISKDLYFPALTDLTMAGNWFDCSKLERFFNLNEGKALIKPLADATRHEFINLCGGNLTIILGKNAYESDNDYEWMSNDQHFKIERSTQVSKTKKFFNKFVDLTNKNEPFCAQVKQNLISRYETLQEKSKTYVNQTIILIFIKMKEQKIKLFYFVQTLHLW